jgi:hypothetical protein
MAENLASGFVIITEYLKKGAHPHRVTGRSGGSRLHNPETEMAKDEALERTISIIEASCDVGPITARRVAEEILEIIWPQKADALRQISHGSEGPPLQGDETL